MKRLIARWINRVTDELMAPRTWEFQSTSWPSDSPRLAAPPSGEPRRHPRSTAP